MSRTLRVAMVAACPFPWPRGTPVRAHRVARAVAELGHEVHVVTYHLGMPVGDEPFVTHRIPNVSAYRKVDAGPTYGKLLLLDPLLARALSRCLDQGPFDVIHAHHYEGLLVAARARRRRLPIVFDAHTTLETELPSYGLGLPDAFKRRIGRFMDRRLPGRADHTIAVTHAVRDRLLAAGALTPDRITVIGNGVDMTPFLTTPARSGGETVVYAGNMAPYQRIDLLLRAFRRVREARPAARLLVVSQDSFRPYEGLARELDVLDGIDLDGSSFERLPGLLAAARVAVNPRVVCDGLPQKNLNYMAAGKPLVAFPQSLEPFEPGESGTAVAAGDWSAFADEVVRLLESPELCRRMGERARSTAMARLTWPSRAREIVAVYRRVLSP